MISPAASHDAHPPVQLSQFNSHTASSADHDINLFRGTVSFAVPLVSLPGRSGLSLDLTASYSSQVAQQVHTTNATAPTGILGLGWSLGLDHIAATYGAAGIRDSATYYAVSGGTRSRLHPTERRWKRADLPLSHATLLTEGPLDPSVITALAEQGLVVNAAARVHIETPGQAWQVVDHGLEFSLEIECRADTLQVFDGGAAYELEQFDFSHIRYYALFEKWVITHPNGQTTVFGGEVARNATGYALSKGASITWGVCWQTFSGPSILTHDPSGQERRQQQYPTAWYVSERVAPTTERCYYTYAPVEQCVGNGGLPYTKAIYLHRITDEAGQAITLTYAEKRYDVGDYRPREYSDPHKVIPNATPDAYQSCYETRYLDSLRVTDAGGSPLETVTFAYDVQVFGDVPSTAHPSRHGDLAKRVLTSITRMRSNGQTLPPLCFTYHKAPALNPGAMATKTAPEGVITRYDYQKVDLPQSLRSVTLPSPLSNAVPRVWFGPNYTVVIWVNALQWTLGVSTWVGRWVSWTLPSGPLQQAINPQDLNVTTEADFFTVDAATANQETGLVLLFHKDPEVLGGWLGTHDTPRILPTPERQVVTGTSFVAVTHRGSTTVDRYTWSPGTRQWMSSPLAAPAAVSDPERYHVVFAGAANSLTILYYQRGGTADTKDSRLSFSYVDARQRWCLGETGSVPNLSIVETDLSKNLSLVHTGWCLALLGKVTETTDEAAYDLLLFTWKHTGTHAPGANSGSEPDIRYTWAPPFHKRVSVRKTPHGTLSTPATLTVTPTGMIACGPILLRYNGETWLENETLALRSPVTDDTAFWFAYGSDLILKVENSPTHVRAEALAFDPNTQTAAWSTEPHVLHQGIPTGNRLHRYRPTARGEYATYNGSIYYRGTASDWTQVFTDAAAQLPEGIDQASLLDRGADFFVYRLDTPPDSPTLQALILDQSAPVAQETIPQHFVPPIRNTVPHPSPANGRSAAGPQTLVTFVSPTGDFDHATALTLHRVFRNSLTRPICDHPIATVTTDTGFETRTQTYTFATERACLDPGGHLCLYDLAKVDMEPQGRLTFRYHNSAGIHTAGHNPTTSAILDGQLLEKSLYDTHGTCVAKQVQTWGVERRATDPVSGESFPLKGLYLHLRQTQHTLGSATTVQTFAYDPGSGTVTQTTVETVNALGQKEEHRRKHTPAYQRVRDLAHVHMLHTTADMTQESAVAANPPVTQGQQAIGWTRFPITPLSPETIKATGSAPPPRLWLPLPAQNFLRQHSGVADPDADPAQWHRMHHITRRGPYGQTLEKVDAGGLTQSRLYDRAQRMTVATVSGASMVAEEAYYYGFEDYEDPKSWALDLEQTPIVTTISVTGRRCLSIPTGATGTPLRLRPHDRTRTYLFSCWMTADPAATDGAPPITAGWTIAYSDADGNPTQTPTTLSLTEESPAQSNWAYYHHPITCTEGTRTLTLTPYNRETSAATLYIDHVAFAPLAGPVRAKVYDPARDVITAEVGPYNQVTHYVYDGLRRHIACTNQFQEVIQVTLPYLSRQDHPTFTKQHPNSQITLQPTGATRYERFRHNGVWSHLFRSATPHLWHSREGCLHYSGTTFGALTCIAPLTDTYMMQMQVMGSSPTGPTPTTVGFSIGDTLNVTWDPGSTAWTLNDHQHDVRLTSSEASSRPDGTWLIVVTPAVLLFFLNGRCVFDYVPPNPIQGTPGQVSPSQVSPSQVSPSQISPSQGSLAFLTAGPVTLSDVIVGDRPQVGLTYLDGEGHVRQSQVLNGRTTQVSTTLFDASGRPTVQVKPVSYDIATGDVFTYRKDVVTAFDWDTGVLSGRATDTYPQDDGYPYQRHLFELSPLRRVDQVGHAGRDFAILPETGSGPHPHVTTHTYNAADAQPILRTLGLAAEQIHATRVRDADGLCTTTITNTLGAVIAHAVGPEGDPGLTLTTYGTTYTDEGSVEWTRLPNFYTPPAESEAGDWVRQITRNLLGQVIKIRGPNQECQRFLYNTAGQVRFSQDAAEAASGKILYHKYDPFGRRLETGLITLAWDAEVLRPLADDPAWPQVGASPPSLQATPPQAPPFVAVQITSYDGAGTEVNGLGQITMRTLHDETTGAPLTSLMYDYDADGQIHATTTIHAETGEYHVTRFLYNTQGQVRRTVYDSGFILDITRDALGRATALSDGRTGHALARYTYDLNDHITEQTILAQESHPIPITYTYNAPGWLSRLNAPGVFEHTVNYTSGKYSRGNQNQGGFYTGRVAGVSTRFLGHGLADDFPTRVDTALDYDPLGRVTAAQVATPDGLQVAWSFGLSSPARYDAHGNLQQVEDGGTPQTYTYAPGTEQIRNTTGTAAEDFTYRPDGVITRADPRGVTHIDTTLVTKRPTRVDTAHNGRLDFLYDPMGNRCRKKSSPSSNGHVMPSPASRQTTRTYVRGVNGWPLTEWTSAPEGTEITSSPSSHGDSSTDYLYGPKGLFAIRRHGQVYPVLLDHQNSVRALLDPDGQIIFAVHYTAFGQPVAISGTPHALTRLFGGYDYDPETGLYDAGARVYDPILKRFYAPDPKRQFASPYVYVNNDPMSRVDPNGEEAWWAIMLGAITGLIATLATGGAGAFLFGMEEGVSLGATTAVAAASGAVGSVVGDATTAGVSGEKITGHRLLVDALSGAAGGAVGEVLGGTTASLAMRAALSKGRTIAQVTSVGMVASGIFGGLGGATAAGAVASAMTHQKFLNTGQALNILSAGFFGGFSNAIVASGSHFGFFGAMPVPLGEDEFSHLVAVKRRFCHFRMVSFDPDGIEGYWRAVHLLNPDGKTLHEVIDIHGIGRFVFPKTVDGYFRPMSSRLFATYMRQFDGGSWVANGQNLPPIKLSCCFSALPGMGSTGRQIANALGRTTQGCINVVYFPWGQSDWQWVRFDP